MEMSTTGGYGDMIRRVVAAQDMPNHHQGVQRLYL